MSDIMKIDYDRISKLCEYENSKILKDSQTPEEFKTILNQAYLGLTCEMFEALTVLVREDKGIKDIENKLECVEEVYDCIQNAVHCLTIFGLSTDKIQNMIAEIRKSKRIISMSSIPIIRYPIVGEVLTKHILKGTFLESKSAQHNVIADVIDLIIASENYLNAVRDETLYDIDVQGIMNKKLAKWEYKIDTF